MSTVWRLLQLVVIGGLIAGCASPSARAPESPPAPSAPTTAASPTTNPTQPDVAFKVDKGSRSPAIRQEELRRFGVELARSRHLSEPAVLALLADARYNPTVVRLVSPPAPGQPRVQRSWLTYRKRVVEPVRINQGRAFMQEHAAELKRAYERYGVPPNIITAIIGVETVYGKIQGNFRVLDALATLGFDYPDPSRPDRAEMFRNQLGDLIELDLTGRLDARTLKGSFAGAVGIPQFMPGSIKRFAVSASGAARIDLTESTSDAIMSVANFLVEHGWQRGLPVFAPVALPASASKLVDGGLKPNLDWPQLKAAGAKLEAGAQDGAWMRAALGVIDLPEDARGTVELRTATPNFFAITQYNRSYFYASSVADLAQALREPPTGAAR
jgi:membrane-bound lytic murein transglycosylase B